MSIRSQVIRFSKTGGPEVLELETTDLPEPGAGEVRVRHTAIGLNFAEIYVRTGQYPMPVPSPIGNEAAGVIEAVGPGVNGFKVGDRVCYGGGAPGSYSTYRNMSTQRLIKTPNDISDEVAAASLLKGMTVEYLLNRCYAVQPGEQVLFYAASGGVGLIAGQWGRSLGANMIGVAGGAEKTRLALAHGYSHVIDRHSADIVARVKALTGDVGVRVAYDSVGKSTFDTTISCLAPRGMFVSFGTTSGPVPPIQASQLQKLGSLYFTRPTLVTYTGSREEMDASANAVFRMIRAGAVKIDVRARYALKDARQAHTDLESGTTVGSSVLVP